MTHPDNLNLRRLRLGTMDANQMENTLFSVAEIFQQEAYSRQGLEFADFLLNRLGAEYASGSRVARQYTHDLYAMHGFLLSLYQEEVSYENLQQDEFDRMERLLRRLASLYDNLEKHTRKDPPPVSILVTLVRACLASDNEVKAVELLIWWTDRMQSNSSEVVPLFRETIKKCLLIGNEHHTRMLIDRLKEMKADYGWNMMNNGSCSELTTTNITQQTDEFVSDEDFGSASFDDNGDSRSNEIRILAEKVIHFVKNASNDDRRQVKLYGNRLLNMPEIHSRHDVCTAFIDYYVKAGRARAAMTWLQLLDQPNRPIDILKKFKEVLEIFDEDSQYPQSSIRAVELFHRMESLESEGKGVLAVETCNTLFRILRNSRNEYSENMLHDTIKRVFFTTRERRTERLPNEETYEILLMDEPSRSNVTIALALFAMHWKHGMGVETQKKLIDSFVLKLSRLSMVEEAKKLMEISSKANIDLMNSTLVEYQNMLNTIHVGLKKQTMPSQDDGLTVKKKNEGSQKFSVQMIEKLPGISTEEVSIMSLEEKDDIVSCVVNLLEVMSDNDDVEIPLNKLCHQLKLKFPKACNSKKNSGFWVFEAMKSGKVAAFKKPKEKEIKICLAKNREIAVKPYPPNDLDTSAEEKYLISMANKNGGYLLRTEVIKVLKKKFKSMQSPFQRTKVIMNAYKNGTLFLRKASCGHLVATTAAQADTEIKALYESYKQLDTRAFTQEDSIRSINQDFALGDECYFDQQRN
eukprot:CAMPEP_0178921794 /NCGR_PEP_ID=MMETSP0786-20121207/15768_1 /TAXON_ID=186022 /ORGANISM="Thalassionema frauenfeldii, Strain CCMP 1798" /LENGTH=748 /DNA_ID=CAMNT_0020596031 /DNA_START=108 /DNA_END=2354 /DNA_ORIENTATION=-